MLNSTLTGTGTKNAYKQYGFNPKGNNETGAMARRFAIADYGTAAGGLQENQGAQSAYFNQLQQLLSQYSLGNRQAQLDNRYRQGMGVAQDQARMNQLAMQEQGLGSGGSLAAMLAANNQAARGAADYQRQLDSPETQNQILQILSQAAQFNPAIQRILEQYYQIIEQRNQANQADKARGGLGGVLGSLGGVLGQMGSLGRTTPMIGGVAGGSKPLPGYGSSVPSWLQSVV